MESAFHYAPLFVPSIILLGCHLGPSPSCLGSDAYGTQQTDMATFYKERSLGSITPPSGLLNLASDSCLSSWDPCPCPLHTGLLAQAVALGPPAILPKNVWPVVYPHPRSASYLLFH